MDVFEFRDYRTLIQSQIDGVRKQSRELKIRASNSRRYFIRNGRNTAVHAMSSINRLQTVNAIAEHLGVSRQKIVKIATWFVAGLLPNKCLDWLSANCCFKGDGLNLKEN